MALPITKWGSWSRSAGIYSALAKQSKLVNYGAVKKLTFYFDPFADKKEVRATRDAITYMDAQYQRSTNPMCLLKTEVRSDRSPPGIDIKLLDGNEVEFKTQHLSTLEILSLFNELISTKAPKKPESTGPILQTKAEKAASKKKKR